MPRPLLVPCVGWNSVMAMGHEIWSISISATLDYFSFRLQLQCYTHTQYINQCFVCMTTCRKMMFLFIWNRTSPSVIAWRSASNLNAPKRSIPIKRLENTLNLNATLHLSRLGLLTVLLKRLVDEKSIARDPREKIYDVVQKTYQGLLYRVVRKVR